MRKWIFTILPVSFGFWLMSVERAEAVSQWARLIKQPCSTCHTPLFARLNYYGERYLRNGYQDPDAAEPDGDEAGKRAIGDMLRLGSVEFWLGARLNLTPIMVEPNAVTVNGEKKTRVSVGNANWLQLFVAGSIFKNMSIYIENEFEKDRFHFAWFYLGFQNLGKSTLLNFQVGRLTPVEFTSYPDRLPQLPALGEGVMRVKSAGGKGEKALDMRGGRFGIQYYGYKGPVVLYAGVSPGDIFPNVSQFLDYWGGVRLEIPETTARGWKDWIGSSVTLHFYRGTDSKNTPTAQVKDDYIRVIPSLNLRFRDKIDIQGAYVYAKDDNWTLTVPARELKFRGVRGVASYYINDHWALSVHYDRYTAEPKELLPEFHRLVFPVITYKPRDNWRISLYPEIDLRDVPSDSKQHKFYLNIRTMF